MRFTRGSSLDLLADALRRADVTWRTERMEEWRSVSDVERQRWRDLARDAADRRANAEHLEIGAGDLARAASSGCRLTGSAGSAQAGT